jgi:hypothetical protein
MPEAVSFPLVSNAPAIVMVRAEASHGRARRWQNEFRFDVLGTRVELDG